MADFDYKAHFGRPAVRRGSIYCAPWCGANCTWAAFQEATKRGEALAKLLGDGWKPRVWENMGWFYEVTNGILEVKTNRRRGKTTYSAWCQSNPQVIGDYYSTPQAAIRSLGAKMGEQLDAQLTAFRALELAYKAISGKVIGTSRKELAAG